MYESHFWWNILNFSSFLADFLDFVLKQLITTLNSLINNIWTLKFKRSNIFKKIRILEL